MCLTVLTAVCADDNTGKGWSLGLDVPQFPPVRHNRLVRDSSLGLKVNKAGLFMLCLL